MLGGKSANNTEENWLCYLEKPQSLCEIMQPGYQDSF
jgi:hypothetical protein